MRACIQRVLRASVDVHGERVGQIGAGMLVLLGVGEGDDGSDVAYLSEKLVHLRIFDDGDGKMNRSLLDCQGSMLVVSQFTLFGDSRRGRRPSYTGAAPPLLAEQLYNEFSQAVRRLGVQVEQGRFRTSMQVELVNDGPVTLWLDSRG